MSTQTIIDTHPTLILHYAFYPKSFDVENTIPHLDPNKTPPPSPEEKTAVDEQFTRIIDQLNQLGKSNKATTLQLNKDAAFPKTASDNAWNQRMFMATLNKEEEAIGFERDTFSPLAHRIKQSFQGCAFTAIVTIVCTLAKAFFATTIFQKQAFLGASAVFGLFTIGLGVPLYSNIVEAQQALEEKQFYLSHLG